jgi:hypothetical protein
VRTEILPPVHSHPYPAYAVPPEAQTTSSWVTVFTARIEFQDPLAWLNADQARHQAGPNFGLSRPRLGEIFAERQL